MKKKVRKFASGGDIITGLGAVLVGKALYDKYKEGKGESKDDDYTRRVKEFGRKGDFPEAKKEEKAAPESNVAADKDEVRDAARERALKQSKDPKSNLVPEGADKSALYESDKALVRTDGKGTKPAVNKPKPRLTPKAQADKSVNKNSSSFAPTSKDVTTSLKERNAVTLEKGTGTRGKDKGFGKATQLSSDSDAAKAMRESRAKRLGTNYNAQFKALQTAPEGPGKEALKKSVAKAKTDYEAATSGMKKGGAVKKYASGGSVSSASKRADGIAIRGKTRA